MRYFKQIYDAILSVHNLILRSETEPDCFMIRLLRRQINRIIFASAFLPCAPLNAAIFIVREFLIARAGRFATFSYRARGVGGLHVIWQTLSPV